MALRKFVSRASAKKIYGLTNPKMLPPPLMYIRHITFMILLSKQQKSQVQATQMRVLRRIEGVSRVDRVTDVDIRLRLGQGGILDVVRRRLEK